jgi:DNA-binding IclR family transcriptional regulator
MEQLDEIRRVGYAIGNEEYEIGLNAVSAPIRDYPNEVKAALAISGPSYRLRNEQFEETAQEFIETARAISIELGHKQKNASTEAVVS